VNAVSSPDGALGHPAAHFPASHGSRMPPGAELSKPLPDDDFWDFRSPRKAECLCPLARDVRY
jgi:hypothetical protein